MSTKNEPSVEYRDQIAKIHTGKREMGGDGGKYVKKVVTGVMASLGPWSACGADRASALANLMNLTRHDFLKRIL